MKPIKLLISTTLLTISNLLVFGQNENQFKLLWTVYIPGSANFDHIAINSRYEKLYVAHDSVVNILNVKTGDSIGTFKNTPGACGIAFDYTHNKGYITNERSHSLTVFNLRSDKVLHQILNVGNPDNILFESYSKQVILTAGRRKGLCIVDPYLDTVISNIPLSGKAEGIVSDERGRLFVNIQDKDQIDVVDLVNRNVINHWPVGPGKLPTSLSIDLKSNRLFVGCLNKLLIILDAKTGKLIDSLPISPTCDGVEFDPIKKYIFASGDDGFMTVLNEIDPNNYKVFANVPTAANTANSMTLGRNFNMAFLPASFKKIVNGKLQTGIKILAIKYK